MSDLQDFHERIRAELDAAFERIKEKKLQIHALVGDQLREEDEFRKFINQYESRFHTQETKRVNLMKNIKRAEKRRQFPDNQWMEMPENPSSGLSEFPGEEAGPATPPVSNSPKVRRRPKIEPDLDDEPDQFGKLNHATQTDHDREKAILKDQVVGALQWVYSQQQLTQQQDTTMDEPSRLLNELKDADTDYIDAVGVLVRMPFGEHDQPRWHALLTDPVVSKKTHADLLYRTQLWNWLLEKGIEWAQQRAQAPPHYLYQTYTEWKQSNISREEYFLDMESKIQEEIDRLDEELRNLSRQS
ncbi:MAG: hypothetical protein AAF787_22780 [Chloroflexota bacterium]